MLLFTLFFLSVTFIMFQVAINDSICGIDKSSFKRTNFIVKLVIILLNFVEGVIALGFAAIFTVTLVALAIVPAYFFQFYKIVRIMAYWIFKTDD